MYQWLFILFLPFMACATMAAQNFKNQLRKRVYKIPMYIAHIIIIIDYNL